MEEQFNENSRPVNPRRKQRTKAQIFKETYLPAIIAGCVSAGLCAWGSRFFDTALLKKLFGVLLLVTGIRELLYKPKTGQK